MKRVSWRGAKAKPLSGAEKQWRELRQHYSRARQAMSIMASLVGRRKGVWARRWLAMLRDENGALHSGCCIYGR